MSTVISLCDLTGNFVQPWVKAGYDAVLVDPQHGFTGTEGRVTKLGMTVEEALPELGDIIRGGDVAMVAAFPPCTHLSASGALHWARKREADFMFQAKAVAVAEQCRTLGVLSGAPWFVENPKGALARVFGPGTHIEPWWYTDLEPADNYTKETYLWHGNGFRVPPVQRNMAHREEWVEVPIDGMLSSASELHLLPAPDCPCADCTLGPPDDRIHKAPPSAARANFRSATPMGFARAVFAANARRQESVA